jgi:elongation factor Ts
MNLELIKELRNRTGGGIVECRQALVEANGDIEKAIMILRQRGVIKAAKKADRTTGEGFIGTYIHSNNKLGVLVALRCETDFVARNAKFQELARNIAMHIAATDPVAISPADIDPAALQAERALALEQLKGSNKPAPIQAKIVEGKLKAFAEERSLVTQVYVKDPAKKVGDLITDAIRELGENITVSQFWRLTI